MIRSVVRGGVIAGLLAVLIPSAVGQAPVDKVVVRDTAKKDGSTKSYDGALVLDKSGLSVTDSSGKLLVVVSFNDFVKFTPGELPGVDRTSILSRIAEEERRTKKDYEAARIGYKAMLEKAATAPEKSKRYLAYKLAMMTTRVADEAADDENWAALAAEAIKDWDQFLTDYATGWEVWSAAHTNARLLAEVGKYAEAARMWSRLAKNNDLPAELRREAAIQEIDAQIRSKSYALASTASEALLATTAPGTIKDRLAVYAAAAKAAISGDPLSGLKEIEAKIAATKEPIVRATGYSLIGELYLAANKPRDAMWNFLWVETVYNTDKDEVFKALNRLSELYQLQNEEDRAKAYREKIRRIRATFAY